MVTRISTSAGAAPAGTTSRTAESLVTISVTASVVTGILTDGSAVTVSVTDTNHGVFDAPLALMTIAPLYVPAFSPEASADTRTCTAACGLFDDADVGENDSQFVFDDTVNGISTSRVAFHTETVCTGGLSPPCTAVNASASVERAISGTTTTGGDAVPPPPPPPKLLPPPPKLPPPPPPPPAGGGVGVVGASQVGPRTSPTSASHAWNAAASGAQRPLLPLK